MTRVKHNGRATEKQISYATALARRAGYSYLSQAVKDFLGKNPINGLSKQRASDLIDWLKEKAK